MKQSNRRLQEEEKGSSKTPPPTVALDSLTTLDAQSGGCRCPGSDTHHPEKDNECYPGQIKCLQDMVDHGQPHYFFYCHPCDSKM